MTTTACTHPGGCLVFATLIVPSLGVRQHPPRRRVVLAYGIGVLGYALGLLLVGSPGTELEFAL